MVRYPHMITKANAGQWPDLVVCVDCRTLVQDVPGCSDKQRELFGSWHMSTLLGKPSRSMQLSSYDGYSVKEFWNKLAVVTKGCRSVLLISYQCGRIWTFLGFWDLMEEGYVRIAERGEPRQQRLRGSVQRVRKSCPDPIAPLPATTMSKLLRQGNGLLVTEDPPCFAGFKCGDSTSRFTWIDCRNHGVEIPSHILPGSGCASELSRWYVDYSSMLLRYNLGTIKLTAGQQAFQGWRYGYYEGGAYVHTHQQATEVEVKSYHGGRCECFKIGPIPVPCYLLDVRSMYPAICSQSYLPVRLSRYHARYSESQFRGTAGRLGVIAQVTVHTDTPDYPWREGDIIIWPIGKFRCQLAGPELADAVEQGKVVEWHDACEYEMQPILKRYADAIYQARVESEGMASQALAASVKKLLVSLPGKFAQRGRTWTNVPDMASPLWWGEWYGCDDCGRPCRYRAIAGLVQRDCDTGLGGETIPSLAAYVTSHGRMVLLRAIRLAGRENVYYCDTDSLLVNEAGYFNLNTAGLIQQGELGKWQLKERVQDGYVFGIKHYRVNSRLVFSGYPKGAIATGLTTNDYWHTENVPSACHRHEAPDGTRTLRTYNSHGAYRHGSIGKDGWVIPHYIEEE